jgi:hypothetical protein
LNVFFFGELRIMQLGWRLPCAVSKDFRKQIVYRQSPSRIRAYSGIIKANIEIKSIRVGGASCGIRSGSDMIFRAGHVCS